MEMTKPATTSKPIGSLSFILPRSPQIHQARKLLLLIHRRRRRRRRGLHCRAPHRIRTGPHRVVHRFLIPLALMLNCWLSRPDWTGFLDGCSTKGPCMSRFSPSSFPVHFPSTCARLLAILTRARLKTKKWQCPDVPGVPRFALPRLITSVYLRN
ncbi:hypothetical protein BGZ61DRAFT_21468 [Ilyonectria robusta]|uniref:uncharacterized protein n=1 Tax=Ilyonectria robusta TaxID=1079257 RepID=UPI001E8E4A34|nr:uncharacterized protein BGZ61DRAFT_21468 [Ilyonectria robusta]KAH8737719.1 hypothetical protein BGZ61DRAFT_21468 [Ilyonectria robusta]